MTNPAYSIAIDWDCPDWSGSHDFTGDEITDDVKHFRIARGKDRDSNTYPAATLEMLLENSTGTYTPTLNAKVRLWLPVRVQAAYNGTTYPLYYGYINRITAYPLKSRQDIYFYATDGIDLLAKTIVVQDMDDKTVMNDGEATNQVLNAAGWKQSPIACTVQAAASTITSADHGLETGDRVMFVGSLPYPIDNQVLYYVRYVTDDTFYLTLTIGGDVIGFLADGSGHHYNILRRRIDVDGGDITNFPDTFEFTKA